MQENPLNIKILLLIALCSLLIVAALILTTFFTTETKIVFCDVGQGDGAYIRVKNNVDIVIDSGQDMRILNCLGQYMPLYDRTIEFVFITHPQFDHMGGLSYILDRYRVKTLFINPIYVERTFFKTIVQKIQSQQMKVQFPEAGMLVGILDARISFFWPTHSFLQTHLYPPTHNGNLYSAYSDLNEFSLIFSFEESSHRVLFTGDATQSTLGEVITLYSNTIENPVYSEILKTPHHGSPNGLSERFLEAVSPTFAVISVGKHNRYGHPSASVIKMLEEHNITVLRTDQRRDIVFTIANGKLLLRK